MSDPFRSDPRALAAVDLVGRTGAESFQIRYQDDEKPTVWVAVALYAGGKAEAAGALDPTRAVLRLCERLIDGGGCTHCGRPSAFEPDDVGALGDGLDEFACWYQFDPELATFRRGCEGDEPADRPGGGS